MIISPPGVFQGLVLLSEYFLAKIDLCFFIPYYACNFLIHLESKGGNISMSLWKLCQTVCLFVVGILLLPVVSWSQSSPDPKLIEGAKKEGQVVYYTTMTLDQSKQTVDRFEKKYPFIKVTLFRTGGGPLLNKIFTESRGGRHDWDEDVDGCEVLTTHMSRKLF